MVALHRGRLRWLASSQPPGLAPVPDAVQADLSHAGVLAVPGWKGEFQVREAERGIAPELLARCTLQERRGGERFAFESGGVARSLKKQFQARRVPQWQRAGPLVWADGRLLYVPGLGIDARALSNGSGALSIEWVPHS